MEKYQISGIYGIDTRKLVRSIRDLGSRKVLITSVDTSLQDGLCKLGSYDIPKDAVAFVSRKAIQQYMVPNGKYHVAAIDWTKAEYYKAFEQTGLQCDSISLQIHPWKR